MPFVAEHTAVVETLQTVPGFCLDTTTSEAATFWSVGSAQVFQKVSGECARRWESAGRERRNRCDEKSSPDVAAVRMLDF